MTRIESRHATKLNMINMNNIEINTQNNRKVDDIRVMVYPNKFDIDNGKQMSVEDIIKGIQTNISRKSVDKGQLPVAYFSVYGFKGKKTSENVTQHSGLIVIDIDVHDNPDTDFESFYNNLLWNNFNFACFRSPSKGIKLVINTDIKDVNHHNAYYHAITEYLLNRYEELQKIDTSGSNINRACYLPFDDTAFLNPFSEVYKVSQEYIDEYVNNHPMQSRCKSALKPLLKVEYLSYDEHFENIKYVLNNWTSMGKELLTNGTSMGKDVNDGNLINENEDVTPVGYSKDTETSMGKASFRGTSMGNEQVSGTLMGKDFNLGTLVGNSNQKRTSMGIYDSVFNEYRFHKIKDSVMSTDVPFLEILVLKNNTPSSIEHKTRLDEIYFGDNPNEPLSTDDFEGLNGLDVCEANLTANTVLKEGHRGKTLNMICIKLIYNNPFCHPKLILKELQRINYFYSQDLNPETNPAPDEYELNAIVSNCYQKFIHGELDFSKVLRRKKTKDEISKRKVFWSRHHDAIDAIDKQRKSIKKYAEGKRNKSIRLYEQAINSLQDGEKITVKRIAEYMGKSPKQVSRYRNDQRHDERLKEFQKIIDDYNESLKPSKP